MNGNTKQYKREELDWLNIVRGLIIQWKAVLIVALLIALVFCGWKYKKDFDAYNSQKESIKRAEEQASMSKEERIAQIIEELPEKERPIVEYLLYEQEWAGKQKNYLKEATEYIPDPTRQRTVKLVYNLEPEDPVNTERLKNDFSIYTYKDDVIEAVKQNILPDADDLIVSQTVKFDNCSEIAANEFRVSIALREDTDPDAVEKALTGKYLEHAEELANRYPCKVNLIDSEIIYEYDNDNASRRSSTVTNINAIEQFLISVKVKLTDGQKKAVQNAIDIMMESEEASPVNADITKPSISVSFLLAGFIIGGLIYALIYLMYLVFRKKANFAEDAAFYTGSRLLGEIYVEKEHNGIRSLFYSKKAEKSLLKEKYDASYQTGLLTKAIEATCEHEGLKQLTLLDMTENEGGFEKEIKEIIESSKRKGVSFNIMSVNDKTDEKTLSESKNVICAVSASSKTEDLSKIMNSCSAYGVNRLGSIWLGEV